MCVEPWPLCCHLPVIPISDLALSTCVLVPMETPLPPLYLAPPAVGARRIGWGAQAVEPGPAAVKPAAAARRSWEATAPALPCAQVQWDQPHTPWLRLSHVPGPGGAKGPTTVWIKFHGGPDPAHSLFYFMSKMVSSWGCLQK